MNRDLENLKRQGSWEWPRSAKSSIRETLRQPTQPLEDRVLAAQLAGDITVMDDDMAGLLLKLLVTAGEPEQLRASAAISLGPALEMADIDGFDDPFDDEPVISERVFERVQTVLRDVFADPNTPKLVQRHALEASVRAEADWHAAAVRKAYAANDPEWKLTAVFCMQYVPGFDVQILEALSSGDELILFHAVRAAGAQEVSEAWPAIAAILQDPKAADLELVLAAIGAAGGVDADKAKPVLQKLIKSGNRKIKAAADEALSEIVAMEFTGDEDVPF